MAATPKTGVIIFRGLSSGKTYQKAFYNADVAGTYCRIDSGSGTPGASGGADFCTFAENVAIVDLALVTGIVDTGNLRLMVDYNPTEYTINWAAFVNTLATRPPINIGISAGRRISFQQLA
jgi:hypothetical protein